MSILRNLRDKVLFLDIDGVLNSNRSSVALGGNAFPCKKNGVTNPELLDWCAIRLIQRLVRERNIEVVLSSTWRNHANIEKLAEALQLPIVGVTPEAWCLGSSVVRGTEIAKWLELNPCCTYAIVDDDSDMLPEQLEFFVHVDGVNGLSFENWLALDKIFEE